MLLCQILFFAVFCFINVFAAAPGVITTASPTTARESSITTPSPPSTAAAAASTSTSTTLSPSTTSVKTTSNESAHSATTPSTAASKSTLSPKIEYCTTKAELENRDTYLCFLQLRDKGEDNYKELSAEWKLEILSMKDPRKVYKGLKISDMGIITMAIIFAILILIGNGIALGYFFRWNYKPLSRRPTDEEMDDVLDADLPVMLISHGKRAGEFQFAAKAEKDTQTIMASNTQQSEQQSTMPSELMSAPDDQDGGAAPGPPPPGTPRRGVGAGKKRGRGGGAGKGGRGRK